MRLSWAVASLVIGATLSTAEAQEAFDAERSDALSTQTSSPVRLTNWSAPPSCISVEELRLQVGKQITEELTAIREVRGEMLRGPAGWVATFTVHDSKNSSGERLLELSGDDCRAHDETLALVVALLLEHGPPAPSEEEPPPAIKNVPAPAQPAEATQEPEPRRGRPLENEAELLRLRTGTGWGATSGWLPSLGWGPTVFLGAQVFERAALDLVGDYYLSRESDGFEEATMRASGGRVHVRGCGLPRWGSWGASICGGVGWVALVATGNRVPGAQTALHGTGHASVSGALVYRLGAHFGLEAGGELVAPFSRGRFVFEGPAGEILVHETRPILFASHVGVVLTL